MEHPQKVGKKRLTLELTLGFTICMGKGKKMKGNGTFIGQVARETGLSIHTIRFYEAQRLLPEAPRTESGYRVYSRETLEALKFVRKAQELGFSLKEIRELLFLKGWGQDSCSHVESLLEEKLESVRAKRVELVRIERELRRNLTQCRIERRRRHPGPEEQCPVLVELGRKPKEGHVE